MASLAVCNNFLALSSITESLILVKSSKQNKKYKLQIPQYNENKVKSSLSNETESDVISVISITSSNFAVCSGKKLTVWDTSTWSVLSSRDVVRAASSIKFTPNADRIVLADKSGDVYLFSISDQEPGRLILGHLSVILDVVISPDEKYIITCDRDEKIRVSYFPNAYNIHCFCLGHKEFVSSLTLIPDPETFLVSCSGDGTVKCWNYTNGLEVSSYCLQSLPSNIILENKSTLAIDSINVLKKDKFSYLICSNIPYLHKIVVLLLEMVNETFIFKFNSSIDVWGTLAICALNSHLWIFTGEAESRMLLFKWDRKEEEFKCDQDTINKLLNNAKEDLKHFIFKKPDSLEYLYKKKYDNVKDYLMKKKARIEGTI